MTARAPPSPASGKRARRDDKDQREDRVFGDPASTAESQTRRGDGLDTMQNLEDDAPVESAATWPATSTNRNDGMKLREADKTESSALPVSA